MIMEFIVEDINHDFIYKYAITFFISFTFIFFISNTTDAKKNNNLMKFLK